MAGERVKALKCGCHPLNAGDLVGLLQSGTKSKPLPNYHKTYKVVLKLATDVRF